MHKSITRFAALAVGAVLLTGSAVISAAPARTSSTQATRPQAAMTFAALEQHAIAMGIRPTELKIGFRAAEIEGRDRDGRKVEVKIDPRSGAVLQREFDD